MSIGLQRRLKRLEASLGTAVGDGLRVWDRADLDPEAWLAEKVAVGEADPNDLVIVRRFFQPGPRGPEVVFLPEPEGWKR